MLPSEVPRLTTDSPVRVFLCVWKFLSFFKTPFLGRSSVATSFISLFCFSGCLMSSAGIQKLFCGIYSAFKCSFDEFVGEKVVSLSYPSTILVPSSTQIFFFNFYFYFILLYNTVLVLPYIDMNPPRVYMRG